MLNKQSPEKIDWTDYTWNPISGCRHGCPYCYMKRMEKRFPGIMEYKYRVEYLADPFKLKKPSKIFTGSSGDMWGEWVPVEAIKTVLAVVKENPRHTFQFLTKNPWKYREFPELPLENTWYGTTDDGTIRTEGNIDTLVQCTHGCNRFVSFEPLLGWVVPDLFGISWVIIGADSNPGAVKPPDEWAAVIIEAARERKIPVWVKDNYKYPERIKEF